MITSLAGRTRRPAELAGQVRLGGFGGAQGLARYLEDQAIDLLVDATHPFAAAISRNAVEASALSGVPRLMLARPAWAPVAGDRWNEVESAAAAARQVATLGRRVFLTVGRQELGAFADLPEVWFLVRLIEALEDDLPLADYQLVLGRGPFAEAAEAELLRARRIDLLVSKNSGGPATYAKIAAARGLGLPVLMIARPALPPGDSVPDVDQALAWIERSFSASTGAC